MSLKGVRQLKELVIRYSDIDGSSRGIRDWIRSDLIAFAEKNPTVLVKTEKKRASHPFIRGHYLNGNSKTICIKNTEPKEIHGFVGDLRNQIGRKTSSNGYYKPVLSERPSIQGEWHERLDLIGLNFKITEKLV